MPWTQYDFTHGARSLHAVFMRLRKHGFLPLAGIPLARLEVFPNESEQQEIDDNETGHHPRPLNQRVGQGKKKAEQQDSHQVDAT
jgi:hypothetical protein